MNLLTSGFAAVVVSFLLAARAADAGASTNPQASAPRQRRNFGPAAQEQSAGRAQEEAAEAAGGPQHEQEQLAAPSWYRMLPNVGRAEEAMFEGPNGVSVLKDGWEAVSGQVRKFSPEQLRQAAIAQMARFRTSTAGEEEVKVPAFLQKILNDPEARREATQLALGAAGMTAAGLMLGDLPFLRDVSLSALFVLGLMQLLKSGAQLAGKVASEQEGVKSAKGMVRQKLAKLLGVHVENEAKEEGAEEQQ